MMKPLTLGSAAADFTAAVIAVAENGAGQSASLTLLTVTTIAVSLCGLGSALYSLAGQRLPERITLDDLTVQESAVQRWRASS